MAHPVKEYPRRRGDKAAPEKETIAAPENARVLNQEAGFYVGGKIGQVEVNLLIDTGAKVSLLNKRVVDELRMDKRKS